MPTEDSSNKSSDEDELDEVGYLGMSGFLLAIGAIFLFLFDLVTGHGLGRSVTLHLIGSVLFFLEISYDEYTNEETSLSMSIFTGGLLLGIYMGGVIIVVFIFSLGSAQNLVIDVLKLAIGSIAFGIAAPLLLWVSTWVLPLLERLVNPTSLLSSLQSLSDRVQLSSLPSVYWGFQHSLFSAFWRRVTDQSNSSESPSSITGSMTDIGRDRDQSITETVQELDNQFAAARDALADGEPTTADKFDDILSTIETLIANTDGEFSEEKYQALATARNRAHRGYLQARLLQLNERLADAEARFHAEDYATAEREFAGILQHLSDLESQMDDRTAPIIDLTQTFRDANAIDGEELETLNEVVAALQARCNRFKTSASSLHRD